MAADTTQTIKAHLTDKERLSLCNDLSTMLGAGISLLEAVESLKSDAKGNMYTVLSVLHTALSNGQTLSEAMERLPGSFDIVSINIIRGAEVGGTLEAALRDIAATTKKELAFSDQLRTTMIYPLFVMVVFTAIVVLMLTFVIPRVAKVFSTMHVHLPLLTKAMFRASAYFVDHWIFISTAVIALLIFAAYIISHNKHRIARLLLSLPLLKTLGSNIDYLRFCRSFGLLMRAGVPVLEALELSERVIQKQQILIVVQQMRRNVAEGKQMSESLRSHKGTVPPILARSIETAEQSGTLEQTLQNLTEYFDEQVNQGLKVIGSLLEPVLLVVVGVMVGTLMITIIAPIYGLISQINSRG